jgi:hypothetical protein
MSKVNEDYIIQRFGKDLPKENVSKLINAMRKYGENYWWESKEPVQIAMYQVFEPILMTDFSVYHEGLERLVGRPVFTHEMGLNAEGLREEARLGIRRLKKGIGTSPEYKGEAVMRSIKMLEDFCKKTGKKLFKVDTSRQSPERDKDGIDRSGEDGWLNH